ncbi:MAG: phenylalanine--tRNA ligase subunit alpha [Candidatus Woesearchaeota archaeon]|nr:phenylalanine--tRNA ligase subunit alpha [Candidatus Woesearchaeota archaeon]
MDIEKSLHPLERKVFPHITEGIDFEDLVKKTGMKDVEVMRALQWMENRELIKIDKKEREILTLDSNGLNYKKIGLPERRFLKAIDDELSLEKIGEKAKLDPNELNICIGLLKKKNAVEIRKEKEILVKINDNGKKLLDAVSDEEKFLKHDFPLDFKELDSDSKRVASELLSRKNILRKDNRNERAIFLTSAGKKIDLNKLNEEVIDKLDSKMLKEGSYKGKDFRHYDVEINVPAISGGRRHFVNQVIEYIKSIWLELGFREMTGQMVQTNFWDLDALFVPQDHPAREMQDTFYLKNPKDGKIIDAELAKKIKATHENGWTTGSLGWRGKWDVEKSKENLLRTHTTVLSAQTISRLKKDELPAKFFAVGKCFRNEALDWKHLFEFEQVEGIVIDPDANFSNLLGYLKEFFMKMGFPDVRIRPGHFPYTEPSAEVDVWHPTKKQWVELGGSGIFRPEVVKPLFGEPVPVLAWGLGLGRMITEYWDIQDIRDLNRNDLKKLREMKAWLK